MMIWNLPNLLALSRILMAPFMLYLMLNPEIITDQGFHASWVNYFVGLIFVIASITDFFDGFIARQLDQKTDLGAILDPLADKMLTLAAFFGLMMMGVASVWAIYIIIVRELFISGLRTSAVQIGLDVSASWAGKVKTVVQMIAIGFLLMDWIFAQQLLWLAVLLTVYSGVEYLLAYAKGLKKLKVLQS